MVNQSRMLKVWGNKVVYIEEPDQEIRLVGLNIAGLEWLAVDPFIERSFEEAMDRWHANIIRMPVSAIGWFGEY